MNGKGLKGIIVQCTHNSPETSPKNSNDNVRMN